MVLFADHGLTWRRCQGYPVIRASFGKKSRSSNNFDCKGKRCIITDPDYIHHLQGYQYSLLWVHTPKVAIVMTISSLWAA
jgi:hypothetical protein